MLADRWRPMLRRRSSIAVGDQTRFGSQLVDGSMHEDVVRSTWLGRQGQGARGGSLAASARWPAAAGSASPSDRSAGGLGSASLRFRLRHVGCRAHAPPLYKLRMIHERAQEHARGCCLTSGLHERVKHPGPVVSCFHHCRRPSLTCKYGPCKFASRSSIRI